ncbi:hypothetical protein [Mycobacterium phage LOCARD]|uniref:Uncharacterized protein n=2 Tax=Cheoctovirus TaxID=1623281 RepID=A0A6G9LD76_9CAUD|nr:gp62 [Mycobacterium phage Ardmore]YP_009963159.1 hypothetical protein I5H96_gp69 [Mycobacterium phage Veteran]ACY39944.1 gp62 [Mycobacterium phage Ardmore]QIQ63417.1 hypothetical protein SEA_VETERAN_69 [Mycobacterium phage Veteran]WDW20042.1 hypothetical protein [Mycobacterium phage LOCARD]
MTGKWVVRMARKRDGSLYTYRVWNVFNPEGQWSGVFESWDEAMRWATDITAHIEYFLGWQESR